MAVTRFTGFHITPACAKWSLLLYVDSAPSGEGEPAIGQAVPVGSCGTPGGKAETVMLVGGGVGFAEDSEYGKQINAWVY
ncbi:MAG: hypothetical protein WA744_22235, partial [Candidatus Acidiferrales bacterium]